MLVNSGSLALKSNMASEFYLLKCVVYIYSPRRNLSVTFLGFEFFFFFVIVEQVFRVDDWRNTTWVVAALHLSVFLSFFGLFHLENHKMSDVYSVSFDSSWEKQTSQKRERDGGSHLHIICPDKSLRHPRCRDKKLFSARAAPYVHVRGYILIHIPDIQNTSLRIHQQMLIGYSICWYCTNSVP
jgi:hypothetical protein